MFFMKFLNFFDFMCWVSFAGFIMTANTWSASSLIALAGPTTMWLIFRHLTGPLTERHSIKRRGDSYKKYQSEVPMIIPFFHFLNYEQRSSKPEENTTFETENDITESETQP